MLERTLWVLLIIARLKQHYLLNHFNLMAGTSGSSMNILIGQSAAALTTLQCYHARDVKIRFQLYPNQLPDKGLGK